MTEMTPETLLGTEQAQREHIKAVLSEGFAQVQVLIDLAVQKERERIRDEMQLQMDQAHEYWADGLENTQRKRAYALGVMAGIASASRHLGADTIPISKPSYWKPSVDLLGV